MYAVLWIFTQATYSGESTNAKVTPAISAISVIWLVATVYCIYKTFRNGRMALFVLGFCFWPLWWVGAFMGKKVKYY